MPGDAIPECEDSYKLLKDSFFVDYIKEKIYNKANIRLDESEVKI